MLLNWLSQECRDGSCRMSMPTTNVHHPSKPTLTPSTTRTTSSEGDRGSRADPERRHVEILLFLKGSGGGGGVGISCNSIQTVESNDQLKFYYPRYRDHLAYNLKRKKHSRTLLLGSNSLPYFDFRSNISRMVFSLVLISTTTTTTTTTIPPLVLIVP
ncbi:hypothetical protein M0802_009826 [Mischocyttarus mexicanus]|nr:hypothetical protein M0802_009826 [Mischocyttarus mexicanus]